MAEPGADAVVGVLGEAAYARLRDDVRALLEEGRAQAEAAAGHVLSATYWRMGQRILQEGLTERASYRDGVVEDLALDLDLPLRTLQYALRFARVYEVTPEPGLSWTHYRELIGLTDGEARAFYETSARSQGWSVRRLTAEIKDGRYEKLAAGELPVPVLPRPDDANYLYRCEVERVIDGDTLVVLIDLGFDVIRRQHLRLVHVQAAEVGQRGAARATRFVRERLARAQTVVVKTARSTDARGRYLGYVFYSGEDADAETVLREGTYLNGELVRRGLAAVALDKQPR